MEIAPRLRALALSALLASPVLNAAPAAEPIPLHRLPAAAQAERAQADAAAIERYRHALHLIALLERNAQLDTVLNESLPGLGLPARTYAAFKFHYLNVARASEFATLEAFRSSDVQLVAFLDGSEREGRAIVRDEAAFNASWQRPKWHILTE